MTSDDIGQSQLAAARRYLSTMPIVEQWSTAALKAMGLTPDEEPRVRRAMMERAEVIEQAMLEAFAQTYTVGELEALAQFYSSPEGRSISQKLGAQSEAILHRLMPVLHAIVRGE